MQVGSSGGRGERGSPGYSLGVPSRGRHGLQISEVLIAAAGREGGKRGRGVSLGELLGGGWGPGGVLEESWAEREGGREGVGKGPGLRLASKTDLTEGRLG